MDLHELTLTELSVELGAKRASSREIVDALLARIAKADGKLHAFTEVYSKEARALADAADAARSTGFPLGPLHGLPIAYKDLCDIAGPPGCTYPCAYRLGRGAGANNHEVVGLGHVATFYIGIAARPERPTRFDQVLEAAML